MTTYWTPQQTDDATVTPICPKCQGLIIEGRCVRCKPKKLNQAKKPKQAKVAKKAAIGFCPGCQRDGQRITRSGFCASCNLHGKQHDERLGEVEARQIIRDTYERVRLRMGTGAIRLG